MLQYLLSLVLNSVRGMKAQGHQLVTRARKGDTGPMGISYRVSFWQAGKEYRNDINNTTASERYIDICVNMPISLIGDSNFRAYQCVTTHTSDNNNNTLGKAGLWTSINSLKPMATPLLLAGKIVADYIDVDTLAVKHLDAADGDFDSLQIREGGSITTGAQVESTASHVVFNNGGLEYKSNDPVHGTTIYDMNLTKSGLSVRYKRAYTGTNIDKTLNLGYGDISIRDDVNNTTEYALFCNGTYKLAVVSSLPSTTDSSTIYIVTGGSKGVYVGSTKIA